MLDLLPLEADTGAVPLKHNLNYFYFVYCVPRISITKAMF